MARSIRALDLTRWADELPARSTWPTMIRRLAHATINSASTIDFPADESVQRSGYDGIIETAAGNSWVPTGRSVWELSVSEGVKGKADADYDTRTQAAPLEERQQTTYVAATLRHWENKRTWRENQLAKGNWKDVKAYDADNFEQWLETAPGVQLWLARLLGLRDEDVDDIDARWEAISKSTSRQLSPAVFLASRESTLQGVNAWLNDQPARLAIAFRSPTEVLDFYCAAVTAMGGDERERTLARSVIVCGWAAWKRLRDAVSPGVLVVDSALELPSEEIGRAVRNGHHVLVAVEPQNVLRDGEIELNRASQYELTRELEVCGYAPVEAEQAARAAAGSLAILKRKLAKYPDRYEPSCVRDVASETIQACLLLGGWEEKTTADLAALERLSGRSYQQLEPELQRLATGRDPILLHAANRWRVISKDEAWAALQDRITASGLREFETLAVEILADDDPRFQLPEEERYLADVRGHTPIYSPIIKRQVAETLALLGTIGPSLEAASSMGINRCLQRTVESLLAPGVSWHRWASLGSSLTMLAEASPDAFLNAVRQEFFKAKPEFLQLLQEEESAIWGRCNHAGLLWSLESLAYSPHYIANVCVCLLHLMKIDPGGRWANRPKSSLGQILSYWMPQTTVPVLDRVKILDLLLREDRDTAWRFFITLLPGMHSTISMPTHKPYWRTWANDWIRGTAEGDAAKFILATAERLIAGAGIDASHWKVLFAHMSNLPDEIHGQFLPAAQALADVDLSDQERRIVSDELLIQIHRHRHYEDAQWSLPTQMLDELTAIHHKLLPRNSVMRHAWLFASHPDRFLDQSGDYHQNLQALDEARKAAFTEVHNDFGFDGVEMLLGHADSPRQVGRMLALVTEDQYLQNIIPSGLQGDEREREFVLAFVWNRFEARGWDWVHQMISRCAEISIQAWILTVLPFEPTTWNLATSLGADCDRFYWERTPTFNPELKEEDIAFAVEKLVGNVRPEHAIELISMALHGKHQLDQETLFLPLENLVRLPEAVSRNGSLQRVRHGIQEILATLQEMSGIELERMLRMEWYYLYLLDEHVGYSPKTLYSQLTKSPEWFVEILSLIFYPKSPGVEAPAPEPTPERQEMAKRAYHLLSECPQIPGATDTGTIDEVQLRNWCAEARAKASAIDRLDVCDRRIGELLARSLAADDGIWPCVAVRNLIEDLNSEDLNSGVAMGILNSREVVCRATGGDQERELVARYRSNADQLRIDYPLTTSILDNIADSYLGQARVWDEDEKWETP